MRAPIATRIVVSVAVLIGVGGCLSGAEPTPVCGTFGGRLTGVADDTVSGCAFFSVKDAGDFGMVLTSGSASDANPAVKLVRGTKPGVGTHVLGQVIDGQCTGPGVLCGIATFEGQTYTLAGTVVLIQSDTMSVTGSLTVTGTGPLGGTLSISGSFSAACHGLPPQFDTPGDQPGSARKPTTCKPGTGSG